MFDSSSKWLMVQLTNACFLSLAHVFSQEKMVIIWFWSYLLHGKVSSWRWPRTTQLFPVGEVLSCEGCFIIIQISSFLSVYHGSEHSRILRLLYLKTVETSFELIKAMYMESFHSLVSWGRYVVRVCLTMICTGAIFLFSRVALLCFSTDFDLEHLNHCIPPPIQNALFF